MITGFNTDLVHNGETYHVQTQERGVNSFVIDTYLYKSGRILESFEVSYEHIKKDDDYVKNVRILMNKQHNKMVKMLKEGRLPYTKKLIQKAQSLADDNDYEQANRYIKEAVLMAPDDENIIKLKEIIEKNLKPQEKKKKYKTIIGSRKAKDEKEPEHPVLPEEVTGDADETILIDSRHDNSEPGKTTPGIIKEGMRLIDEGKLNEAVRILEEAYENDPDNYDLFEILQSARLEMQQKAEKEEIPCLFELNGKKYYNVERAVDEGLFLFGDLQYKEARDLWAKALEFDPENQKIAGFIKEAEEAVRNESLSGITDDRKEHGQPDGNKEPEAADESRNLPPDTCETVIIDRKQVLEGMSALVQEEAGNQNTPVEIKKSDQEETIKYETEPSGTGTANIPVHEEKTENIDPEQLKNDTMEEELNETIELDPEQLEMKSQGTAEMPYTYMKNSIEKEADTAEKYSFVQSVSAGDTAMTSEADETVLTDSAAYMESGDETDKSIMYDTPASSEEAYDASQAPPGEDLPADSKPDKGEGPTGSILIDTKLPGKKVISHARQEEPSGDEKIVQDATPEKEPEPEKGTLTEKKTESLDAVSGKMKAEPQKAKQSVQKTLPGEKRYREPVLGKPTEDSFLKESKPLVSQEPVLAAPEKKETGKKAEKTVPPVKQSKTLLYAVIALILIILPVLVYFFVKSSNIAKMKIEAEELYNNGDYSGAARILDRLLDKYPEDRDLLWLRARSYFESSEYEKAKSDYMRLNDMYENTNIDVLFALATIETYFKNANNLVALIPKIIKLENTAQNYLRLSDLAAEVHQELLAIDLLEKAFSIEPNNWNILSKKSRLYFETGDHENARKGFEKLYEIDKVNKEYPFYLARIYYKNNEYNRALIYLNNIIDKEIDKSKVDYRVLHLLGDVYKKMQVHSQAFQKYNETKEILEKLAANDSSLLPELAMIYNKTGMTWLERAVEFNDKKGSTLQNALKDFEKAVELDPGNGESYANLGKTYEFLGDIEKAVYYFYEALVHDRGNTGYYIALSRIYRNNLKEPERAYTTLKDAYDQGIFDCSLLSELLDIAREIEIDAEILNRIDAKAKVMGCQ